MGNCIANNKVAVFVLPLPQSAFAELKVTLSWVIKVYVFFVCVFKTQTDA